MSWPTFRDSASQAVGRQLSNPSGVGGRLVGRIMGIANRLPVRALIQALEIRNEHRVLDVGCGDGSALAAIPHAAWRCGVDRSETMLAVARRRLRGPIDQRRAELLLGDMMKLPFEAGSFDRFIDDLLCNRWILIQEHAQLFVDERLHDAGDIGVELAFRLPFKLRLRQFYANNSYEPFADVVAG